MHGNQVGEVVSVGGTVGEVLFQHMASGKEVVCDQEKVQVAEEVQCWNSFDGAECCVDNIWESGV